ncbi:unnamed protein product [Cuscuta europaea]|uniref:Cystatin domain-containing protein n=1 Tax=Cuscuta europaea TaxID=41803 RepID=A0A9P0YRP3_CUSEU|nr:unnamed protein product [Cuscuta europaea]
MMIRQRIFGLPSKRLKIGEQAAVEVSSEYDEEEEESSEYEEAEMELESVEIDHVNYKYTYNEEDYDDYDEEFKREVKRYIDALNEVGPYNIDFMVPDFYICNGAVPVLLPPGPESHDYDHYAYREMQNSLKFAIDEHNEGKDAKLVLHKTLRANFKRACGFIFFITFQATDTASGETSIYRTCVVDDVVDKIMTINEFRQVETEELKGAWDLEC